MQNNTGTQGWLQVAAAAVIVLAGLNAAHAVVVPFLLAAFIAVICAPPLFWLRDRGLPQGLALILVFLMILAGGLLFSALLASAIGKFSQQLPLYQANLQTKFGSLLQGLAAHGLALPEGDLRELVNPATVMNYVGKTLSGLGAVLTNGFFILLTVVFMLLEASTLPAKLTAAFGQGHGNMPNLGDFVQRLKHYMSIKTSVSAVTGLLIGTWLAILGVDFALLWGVLAFLLNFVPNIGSIIAAVPALLLAWVQLDGMTALLAGLGYLVVNVVAGNIVEPRFMGRGVGLSTLVVFLSLVFWGWLLGPVGMFLSVPLTMAARMAMEQSAQWHWLYVLLGPEPEVAQGGAKDFINPAT